MKIQELRIGNWFQDKFTSDRFQVILISDEVIVFDYETEKEWQAEPIPLTEEILLKCGFYQENGVMSYATQDYSSVKITYETLAKYYRLYPYTYRIDYLHQLQNLYFDLTGEELEVKL